MVKPIHVLSDYAIQLAQLLQLGDGVVGGVGLEVVPTGSQGFAQSPDSLSCFPVTDELLVGEIIGVEFRPEAIGAPEVRKS